MFQKIIHDGRIGDAARIRRDEHAAPMVRAILAGVDMLRAQPSRERATPEERAAGQDSSKVAIFPPCFQSQRDQARSPTR